MQDLLLAVSRLSLEASCFFSNGWARSAVAEAKVTVLLLHKEVLHVPLGEESMEFVTCRTDVTAGRSGMLASAPMCLIFRAYFLIGKKKYCLFGIPGSL